MYCHCPPCRSPLCLPRKRVSRDNRHILHSAADSHDSRLRTDRGFALCSPRSHSARGFCLINARPHLFLIKIFHCTLLEDFTERSHRLCSPVRSRRFGSTVFSQAPVSEGTRGLGGGRCWPVLCSTCSNFISLTYSYNHLMFLPSSPMGRMIAMKKTKNARKQINDQCRDFNGSN